MKPHRIMLTIVLIGLTMASPRVGQAAVIAEFMPVSTGQDDHFHGQSLTTPAGGPWQNIQFNFFYFDGNYGDPTFLPAAQGNLFILSSEYLGEPGDLSSTTTGFVAQSTGIVGDVWQFDAAVSLAGTTQYWFYADTSFYKMAQSGFVGGQGYLAFDDSPLNFAISGKGISYPFRLQGDVAAIPLPAASLGMIACTGIAMLKRQRGHRRAAA